MRFFDSKARARLFADRCAQIALFVVAPVAFTWAAPRESFVFAPLAYYVTLIAMLWSVRFYRRTRYLIRNRKVG